MVLSTQALRCQPRVQHSVLKNYEVWGEEAQAQAGSREGNRKSGAL